MNNSSYSIGWGESFQFHSVYADQWRHDQKVREAVKANLADLVSEEHIAVSDGRRIINVPLPLLKEFRISFDRQQAQSVGQAVAGGEGEGTAGGSAPGAGVLGGSEPGLDVEDAAITLEEAADIVFERLGLPDLDPQKHSAGNGYEDRPESWAPHGLKSRWVRRPTVRESLKRQALAPGRQGPALAAGDFRYWRYDLKPQEEGGAVVLAMMDTSGSMGTFEKYLAKSFFFWTVEFLRRNYPRVEIVFLAHDVRAREVDEESFFRRGSSGGTVSSSVYRLALDILGERYPQDRFNRYAFHFTDGGNLTSDNALAVEIGTVLAHETNLFGYGEIHDTDRNPSPLYQAFRESEGTGVTLLRRKEDIFRALEYYFTAKGNGHDHSQHA